MTFHRSILQRALLTVVALKVVGIVLIFDWQGRMLQAIDLPKTVWSRATEWLIVAVVLLSLLRYGTRIVPRSKLHLAVAVFLGTQVLAMTFAESHYIALFGNQTHFLGLTFFVDMVVLYVGTAIAVRTDRDRLVLLGAFGLATVLSGIYAFLQYVGVDPMSWEVSSKVRPFSTFGNANMYGHFLTVAVVVGMAVAISTRGRMRLVGGALGLFALGVSAVVASRGALFGLPAAAATLALLYRSEAAGVWRWAKVHKTRVVIGCGFALALIAMTPFGSRAVGTLSGSLLVSDRLRIYESALQMVRDRPLLGYGPDNFAVVYPRYRTASDSGFFGVTLSNDSAHDWILETAVGSGLIGLSSQLALLGCAIWLLLRRRRSGAVAPATVVLTGLVGYWAYALVSPDSLTVDWVPWLLFGITAGVDDPTLQPPMVSTRRWALFIAPVVVGVALVAGSAGLNLIDANRAAYQARKLNGPNRIDDAVAAAKDAVTRDPGRAGYWNELGRAYYTKKVWSEAGTAFAMTVERAPWDPSYWVNLSLARTQQTLAGDQGGGGAQAAIDAGKRAVAASPNFLPARAQLPATAFAVGDYDLAAREAIHAVALGAGGNSAKILIDSIGKLDRSTARAILDDANRRIETGELRALAASLALVDGDPAAARSNAQRALELQPGNAEATRVLQALP